MFILKKIVRVGFEPTKVIIYGINQRRDISEPIPAFNQFSYLTKLLSFQAVNLFQFPVRGFCPSFYGEVSFLIKMLCHISNFRDLNHSSQDRIRTCKDLKNNLLLLTFAVCPPSSPILYVSFRVLTARLPIPPPDYKNGGYFLLK